MSNDQNPAGSGETSPCGQTEHFKAASLKWRGVALTGEFAHYCHDWDGLPVDETCDEFTSCTDVGDNPRAEEFRQKLRNERAGDEP